jgi:uncharacterized membrane protein (DUF106 family)
MEFPEWGIIACASLVFSLSSYLINRVTGVKKRTKELQGKMKAFQEEIKNATRSNDEKKLKELEEKMPGFNKEMGELMLLPWKSLLFVIPLFVVIGDFVTGTYPKFSIQLPFALHLHELFNNVAWWNPVSWLSIIGNLFQTSSYGPRGFFIVCALFFGPAIEAVAERVWKSDLSNSEEKNKVV